MDGPRALALLGTLFGLGAACADSPREGASQGPLELSLWHSYAGAERRALESSARRFEESRPGLRVTLSAVPHEALTPKLTASIPHGHGPDLFIYAHDRIGGWAEGAQVQPLELFVTQALLDAHLTPCVLALAYGDSLYGLPLAYKALALYVRTDLVAKPPETFDELLEIGRAATVPREGRYGLVYGNADLFSHAPLLFSLGGRIFAEEHAHRRTDPRIDVVNEGMIRSFALARRLAKDEGILPGEPSQVTASAMFADGRTPMVISGPWFRSEIPPGIPYTVVPLPAFPGGVASSGFSTCEAVLMSARSRHKLEAFELMSFLANDPSSAEIRLVEAGQPVTLRETYDEVLPRLEPPERAILRGFRAAFEQSVTSPSQPSMAAVWMPMNAALYLVIHKDLDPAEAAARAQRRIDRALRALR